MNFKGSLVLNMSAFIGLKVITSVLKSTGKLEFESLREAFKLKVLLLRILT